MLPAFDYPRNASVRQELMNQTGRTLSKPSVHHLHTRIGETMGVQQVQDWLLSQYNRWRGLLPGGLLYHADHFRVRRLLEAAPELQAVAIEHQLRHVLANAIAHVPFYRNNIKLTEREIDNEAPAALLEYFPYISKAQVMASQRDFLDERRDGRLLRYATSHGSSGEGIGVWRDKRQADIEKAFYAHQ